MPGRPDPAGDLEPADVGQADVQDHDLDAGRSVASSTAVVPSAASLDHVAVFLQQALEQAPQALVVFDDEEVHRPSVIRTGCAVEPGAPRMYAPILRIS